MNPFGNRKRLYATAAALAALVLGGALWAGLRAPDLRLVGTVDANQVLLSGQVAGRVERLLVYEGQDVKAGDLVAVLDGLELSAAAESIRAQAGSRESQLQAAWATARSTAGEVSSGVAAARAALEMAQASREEATAGRLRQEALARRVLQLAQQGAVAAQDRDDAQRNLEMLQARERSARKAVDQAESALRIALAREHQGQAARETAASLQSELRAARAQAREADARLGHTRIYAPVDGRVATVVAREGEVVAAGAPVAALVELAQTWVQAALPETEAGVVTVGTALKTRLPGGAWVEGRVIAKGVEADFATQRDTGGDKRDIRTVRLKLLIPNPQGRFVPGMTAEVFLPARLRRAS